MVRLVLPVDYHRTASARTRRQIEHGPEELALTKYLSSQLLLVFITQVRLHHHEVITGTR